MTSHPPRTAMVAWATVILPYFECGNEFKSEKHETKWHFTEDTLPSIIQGVNKIHIACRKEEFADLAKNEKQKDQRSQTHPCDSMGKPRPRSLVLLCKIHRSAEKSLMASNTTDVHEREEPGVEQEPHQAHSYPNISRLQVCVYVKVL